MVANATVPKRLAFFTAGAQPTPGELAEIENLNTRSVGPFTVTVMRADQNYSYGAPPTWQNPDPVPNTDVRAFDYASGAVPAGWGANAGNPATYTVPAPGLPDSLMVAPQTLSIPHGGSTQLAAVTKDSSGNLHDLTTDPTVTWTSSNPAVATVGAHTGLVTGVTAGVVNIVATIVATDGSGTTTTAHSSITLT